MSLFLHGFASPLLDRQVLARTKRGSNLLSLEALDAPKQILVLPNLLVAGEQFIRGRVRVIGPHIRKLGEFLFLFCFMLLAPVFRLCLQLTYLSLNPFLHKFNLTLGL